MLRHVADAVFLWQLILSPTNVMQSQKTQLLDHIVVAGLIQS